MPTGKPTSGTSTVRPPSFYTMSTAPRSKLPYVCFSFWMHGFMYFLKTFNVWIVLYKVSETHLTKLFVMTEGLAVHRNKGKTFSCTCSSYNLIHFVYELSKGYTVRKLSIVDKDIYMTFWHMESKVVPLCFDLMWCKYKVFYAMLYQEGKGSSVYRKLRKPKTRGFSSKDLLKGFYTPDYLDLSILFWVKR